MHISRKQKKRSRISNLASVGPIYGRICNGINHDSQLQKECILPNGDRYFLPIDYEILLIPEKAISRSVEVCSFAHIGWLIKKNKDVLGGRIDNPSYRQKVNMKCNIRIGSPIKLNSGNVLPCKKRRKILHNDHIHSSETPYPCFMKKKDGYYQIIPINRQECFYSIHNRYIRALERVSKFFLSDEIDGVEMDAVDEEQNERSMDHPTCSRKRMIHKNHPIYQECEELYRLCKMSNYRKEDWFTYAQRIQQLCIKNNEERREKIYASRFIFDPNYIRQKFNQNKIINVEFIKHNGDSLFLVKRERLE